MCLTVSNRVFKIYEIPAVVSHVLKNSVNAITAFICHFLKLVSTQFRRSSVMFSKLCQRNSSVHVSVFKIVSTQFQRPCALGVFVVSTQFQRSCDVCLSLLTVFLLCFPKCAVRCVRVSVDAFSFSLLLDLIVCPFEHVYLKRSPQILATSFVVLQWLTVQLQLASRTSRSASQNRLQKTCPTTNRWKQALVCESL